MKKMSITNEMVIYAMNESAREVYMVLRFKKLKVGQIERKTKFSPRTVSDLHLVKQIPDLTDFRSHYYIAS